MSVRLRRRNSAWLAAMGLLIAFALLAGGATPPVQITLLAIFAITALISIIEIGRERESLIDTLRRVPVRQRVSAQAREAQERAKAHGGYSTHGLTLMDTGLIALQSSYEGMAMRRARTISKDDDGVRPFITLNIEPEEADRNAVVRFEILNQYGDQIYIHEMKAYLRDGEMSIMADHHLPLAGNRNIDGTGDWDLRVSIDGNLVGIHNFTLAPSINERSRRLSTQYEDNVEDSEFDIIDEVKQEIPASLQDLMQEKSRASRQSSSTGESSSRRIGTTSRRRR
jgi:hypothetical protein